ncbi:MAG: flagellin [Kiloniellales bacterium]
MTRVATFALHQLTLSQTMAAQSRYQELNIQVSSGKKAQQYKGIASETHQLIDVETIRAQAQRFTANINQADRRLETMENSTAAVFDLASALRTLLINATSGNNANYLELREQARNMLEQAAGLLNSKLDGRYLFSGSRTDTAPIDLDALLNPSTPLVDAVEFSGAATTAGTGFTSMPGIVSLRVPSGSFGDAYQITYDGAGTLSLRNLANGTTDSVTVTAPPLAGETADYTFNMGGTEVVVTLDQQFAMLTPIANQPISGTVGGGGGAFGAISLVSSQGDISKITSNVVDVSSGTADASDITLTLPSADGNFVASGLDFETATGVQTVTLTNALTGGSITLSIDITTTLDDATTNDPGTEINLGDALVNIAATAGATSPLGAVPGEPGYDPANPSYYQGNATKLTLRADQEVTVSYGVTAADAGFEKLIRALYITMQAAEPGNINLDDLGDALKLSVQAIEEIPNIRSQIGTARKSLETLKSAHADMTLLAERIMSEIEDTDVVKAMSLLVQNTTQIEASFSTLSRLTTLSLLQFI